MSLERETHPRWLFCYCLMAQLGAHMKRSAAPALFQIFPPSAKDLTRQALPKANLLKINFHISSLCQDRSGAEDFSANCWCFAAIFASGAFCNSSWWSRGAQPLLCAQIAAADNTVKQSPRAHYVHRIQAKKLLKEYYYYYMVCGGQRQEIYRNSLRTARARTGVYFTYTLYLQLFWTWWL